MSTLEVIWLLSAMFGSVLCFILWVWLDEVDGEALCWIWIGFLMLPLTLLMFFIISVIAVGGGLMKLARLCVQRKKRHVLNSAWESE